MMLLSDVSSVLLHANSVNSILHGLSRNMLTSCLHSLSSCSTLRWPVVYFQHPRSVPLSLQLSRRWHWIHSIWATTGRFPIWHLFLSWLNMQLMSKLLDTRRKINFSHTLNQHIRSTGRRKRQYLKCYLTSTRLTLLLAPPLARYH